MLAHIADTSQLEVTGREDPAPKAIATTIPVALTGHRWFTNRNSQGATRSYD